MRVLRRLRLQREPERHDFFDPDKDDIDNRLATAAARLARLQRRAPNSYQQAMAEYESRRRAREPEREE